MIKFEKREYLAQHIILSTMSVRLGAKTKDLDSAKDMWTKVKANYNKKHTVLDRCGRPVNKYEITG